MVRGTLEALTRPETVAAGNPEDYLHVTLTDPLLPPDAQARLRGLYPNIFRMEYARPRRGLPRRRAARSVPPELFRAFYRFRTGREMDVPWPATWTAFLTRREGG